MKKIYGILFLMMLVCVGCEWQLKTSNDDADDIQMVIDRYDRIESLYLTTGDYSALQQMNTSYPMQTRMLIEDMLHVGKVDDPEINTKFLHFFQDSTLQKMLMDVQHQYADLDDLNEELTQAFKRLKERLPEIEIPEVYAQIGSFDQSIVIGHQTVGISLDKYLGSDYSFYKDHYTEDQRRLMVRSMIVPDCLSFYILSQYPLQNIQQLSQGERDHHMGKIQWLVNEVTGRQVFKNTFVSQINEYMKHHQKLTIIELLSSKKI